MVVEQLLTKIKDPQNKVFKTVVAIKAGVENVKYSLRSDKGKLLLYVLGSEMGNFAPDWVINRLFVDGEKQSCSSEQIAELFMALSKRHAEEEKKQQEMLLRQNISTR